VFVALNAHPFTISRSRQATLWVALKLAIVGCREQKVGIAEALQMRQTCPDCPALDVHT
jgi:hypothetical protein